MVAHMLEPVLGANEMAKVVFENNQYILRNDWGIDDVRAVIESTDNARIKSFTDDDCVRVLEIVAECFDANYGITWDSLEHAITTYVEDSK